MIFFIKQTLLFLPLFLMSLGNLQVTHVANKVGHRYSTFTTRSSFLVRESLIQDDLADEAVLSSQSSKQVRYETIVSLFEIGSQLVVASPTDFELRLRGPPQV